MNNRQANNNGRRRGRGGQQRQGGNPGQRDNGNRIDNRARGNAAQLLEKYKNLARDAQMQGDRVNAEYYLQFADHYFRVLSETRARFEEQNPQAARRVREDAEEDGDDFDFDGDGNRDDRDERQQQQQQVQQRSDRDDREPRGDREARAPREARGDREDRPRRSNRDRVPNGNVAVSGNGAAPGYAGQQAVEGEPGTQETLAEAPQERPRRGRPRREAPVDAADAGGIDVAVLPPAFGADSAVAPAEEADKKPRRRRARSDDAEVSAA